MTHVPRLADDAHVIPACHGELGLKLVYHVPWVHALPGPKEVEIEWGEEALYPSADAWVPRDRFHDDERAGIKGWRLPPGAPLERFVPEPHETQDVGPVDVVVCPRWRRYGKGKNWHHWQELGWMLQERDLAVFAAGAPDSSLGMMGMAAAWSFPRFLDASIEAIRKAKLVIATDAGLAHLAVLCGTPLLLIHHAGLTAPGAVLDVNGRAMQPVYPPMKLHRYDEANHTGSLIRLADAWHDPALVARKAVALMEAANV